MIENCKVCIVIPIYKNRFSEIEEWSVSENIKKLSKNDVFFVAPEPLDCNYYKKIKHKSIIRFDDDYFVSQKKHNKLLLNEIFYKTFMDYEYMCICQPDVILFGNSEDLEGFSAMGYDYIGAPWYPPFKQCVPEFRHKTPNVFLHVFFPLYEIQVGNGGLSLRNIESCSRLLVNHKIERLVWRENEDKFFSLVGKHLDKEFKVAPEEVAKKFSLETDAKKIISEENYVPFGIHAFEKHYSGLKEDYKMLTVEYNRGKNK